MKNHIHFFFWCVCKNQIEFQEDSISSEVNDDPYLAEYELIFPEQKKLFFIILKNFDELFKRI